MDCEKTRNIFKLNQLPSEILECVFHYLPRTSLIECQKVNKTWYTLSSPLIWEKIEICYVNQASSIISNLSYEINSKLKKYVKSLKVYREYKNIEIDFIKQLLLLFPRIEEIHLPYTDHKSISEISNPEYLSNLVQSCPNITSFQLDSICYCGGTMIPLQKDYNDILYALRHSLLKIVMMGEKNNRDHWDLSDALAPFPQLEELDLQYIRGSYGIKWWLPIFKVLPRLKSLHIQVNNDRDPCLIDKDVETFIDKNTLQKRLGAIKKLSIKAQYNGIQYWFTPALTHFITQYLVGLKEMFLYIRYQLRVLTQEDLWDCQELLNFICSREKYKIDISVYVDPERNDGVDFVNIFLHTNFNHTLLDNRRNILNDLQITLHCNNTVVFNGWDIVLPDVTFDIELTSQRINNHQILRTTQYRVSFHEQDKDTAYKSLSSILPTLNENDTLTIKIKSDTEIFPFANFELIGQALSMVSDPVKKITLEILSDMKWSQYFMKYKKIQNYHQFTHLEILVHIIDDQTADQLGFSQLSIIFPNVKNLALQYYNGIWDEEKYEFLMNLSRLNLDHFTLDISLIKYKARQLMKEHNDFCGASFILHIETKINEYSYQVLYEDLSIKELKVEDTKKACESKMITVHIILNDIKCLELYLLNMIYTNNGGFISRYEPKRYDYDGKNIESYDAPHKELENKINFT